MQYDAGLPPVPVGAGYLVGPTICGPHSPWLCDATWGGRKEPDQMNERLQTARERLGLTDSDMRNASIGKSRYQRLEAVRKRLGLDDIEEVKEQAIELFLWIIESWQEREDLHKDSERLRSGPHLS